MIDPIDNVYTLRQVGNKEAEKFFTEHSEKAWDSRANRILGLYTKSEQYASMMSFRFGGRKGHYEMLDYTNVITELNGLGRLFKSFRKMYDPKTIRGKMKSTLDNPYFLILLGFKKTSPLSYLWKASEIDEYEWSDHEDYGDIMTLEEWKKCCESGAFIDYDGRGYLGNEKQSTDIKIYPSMVKYDCLPDNEKFTHVAWFNR